MWEKYCCRCHGLWIDDFQFCENVFFSDSIIIMVLIGALHLCFVLFGVFIQKVSNVRLIFNNYHQTTFRLSQCQLITAWFRFWVWALYQQRFLKAFCWRTAMSYGISTSAGSISSVSLWHSLFVVNLSRYFMILAGVVLPMITAGLLLIALRTFALISANGSLKILDVHLR